MPINKGNFDKKMDKLLQTKKNVMPNAYKEFVKVTPKDTGKAKSSTRLSNYVIIAKYSYAYVLDKGRHMTSKGARGSKQAPSGMSKPTIKKMIELVNQYIRKL